MTRVKLTLLVFLLAFLFYNAFFFGKIYPNISVAGSKVGGLTPQKASEKIRAEIVEPQKIVLTSPTTAFEISLEDISLSYDFDASAKAAFELMHTGNVLYDFARRITILFAPKNLGLRFSLNEKALDEALGILAQGVEVKAVYPSARIVGAKVVIDKGKKGTELDQRTLRALIGKNFSLALKENIPLPLKEVDPTLSDREAEVFRERLERIKAKSLTLKFESQTFNYKGVSLFPLVNPKGEYSLEGIKETAIDIAQSVNREPQNSVFVFEGGRVKEFAPAKDGIVVKLGLLSQMIEGNLRTLEGTDEVSISFEIPVERKAPKIKTEDVNNLGIKELIGRGSSHFSGSIANRIYNIGLSSSRFKGVLIPPGEILSFNDIVGDVSNLTGYKQAYVIKDGKTVLGDGGGVCQVSTTLFRAALNAGLPIVERRAHSYRVSYYEQDSPPGLDATVYAPTTDLKIKNDTPGHILIQPVFDAQKATLAFEIYGTSDGRVASVTKPVVTNVTPPPEDLYVDDPTLPAGKIKQVDFKAWGAKVTFTYKVERGGETIYQKTFVSNYRPWQAAYLRGTGPAN